MAKLPYVSTITTGYASVQALNDNFEALKTAFTNTVSRDGSTPNSMSADLDLNSNDVKNVKTIDADSFILNGTLMTPSGVDPVYSGTISAFGASLIDDADASTARTTLGLGGLGTAAFVDVLDEDDMVSDSATAVSSQQATKAYVDGQTLATRAYVDGQALGVGQTWQDVTSSRAFSTVYQNTTGRTISVSIFVSGNDAADASVFDLQVSSDNVTYTTIDRFQTSTYENFGQFRAEIPDNMYYKIIKVSGPNTVYVIGNWVELR